MAKDYHGKPSRVAPETARELRDETEIITLSTGVNAKIKAVAASLIDAVTARVQDPDVPMVPNPDKDNRLEPYPLDPGYIKARGEANRKRGQASIDAIVMFGVELVDPIPPDDEWLKQLRYLEARGTLDLSEFDFSDPMDREFVYKRFVAVGSMDLLRIARKAGISQEALKRAAATFPGDGTRGAD